jgi:hypothetical protein
LPGKGRRAVRVFFNTYYEESASKIINALKSLGYGVRVQRSRVVPELYYIDIDAGSEDLEKVRQTVEDTLKREADDTVFGVKVYAIDANR